MNLTDLRPNKGSIKNSKRKGRGPGTGNGKTAGRGQDGQNSRSGGGTRPGFEGGQMPIYRRLPKRGFTCRNSKEIIGINLDALNVFRAGSVVTLDKLQEKGIINNPKDGVKILGSGELTKKLTVKMSAFSKTAIEKIEAAGGKAEVV
ncbi:MAG: 50S ribosomal protein L15 [Vallitaleaceae bacterium]|jgi:large subunit ribosomal protein L15|nr:50S ribosomal protein L15 [Vallitaleaceae bacterium]